MEKLKLSENEKRLLRNISADVGYWPDGMSNELVSCAASVLERLGLVRVEWESGHIAANALLTDYGRAYILANPHLRGPVDWEWIIGTSIAVIAALGTIAVLFVACVSRWHH